MEKQTDVNLPGGVVVAALCDGADPSVEEGGRSVPATLGDDQSPHLFLQGTANITQGGSPLRNSRPTITQSSALEV